MFADDGKCLTFFLFSNEIFSCFFFDIRYSISQDESLWRSLVHSYGLHHQTPSTSTSKQRIQTYLNQQIRTQLKSLFSMKFDVLKSYTGIPDYQKMFNK